MTDSPESEAVRQSAGSERQEAGATEEASRGSAAVGAVVVVVVVGRGRVDAVPHHDGQPTLAGAALDSAGERLDEPDRQGLSDVIDYGHEHQAVPPVGT